MEKLIAEGANLDARGPFGRTPIYYVSDQPMFALFCDRANIEVSDERGISPLCAVKAYNDSKDNFFVKKLMREADIVEPPAPEPAPPRPAAPELYALRPAAPEPAAPSSAALGLAIFGRASRLGLTRMPSHAVANTSIFPAVNVKGKENENKINKSSEVAASAPSRSIYPKSPLSAAVGVPKLPPVKVKGKEIELKKFAWR